MANQMSVGSTSTLPQSLYLTEPGDSSPISVNDIHQGGIGDCFFLASTGALAQFYPDRISQMIHANGDGSFTVDLFVDSNAQPVGFTTSTFSPQSVTVTASFPSNSANNGSWDIVGGQKEIWVQVLEKAFAQLYGGYAGIQNGGNPLIATETLTGQPGLFLSPDTLTAASLAQNIASGDLVTFDTGSPSGFGLVANHSYFLEGLQNVGGIPEVQLGNPWGFNQPSLIPVSAIASSFVEIDVGKVGAPAPVPPAPTPAPVAGNTVQLHISEDAWIGNAQFVVKVDGVQVGDVQTALASHAAGQSQNFTLSGLTAGSHSVGVQFINDAWGGPGTVGMDRNLYVDGISVGGVEQSNSQAALYSNGVASFRTPGSNSAITLNVSEDAYKGDAQVRVSMDGADMAGLVTVSALHAAGQEQQISFFAPVTPGAHSFGITLINDAWGGPGSVGMDRNAYLDSLDIGSSHFATHVAQYSNGTTTTNVTAIPVAAQPVSIDIGAVQLLSAIRHF